MIFLALGTLVMVTGAWLASVLIAYAAGKRDGVEQYLDAQRDRRSQLRKEARTVAPERRQLTPFPAAPDDDDEWLEKLATTGELRAYAETGELDRLRGEVAQFFRTWDLRTWTRKRQDAA